MPDNGHGAEKSSLTALTVASIGVVYGDIGTSPLYAMRAAFGGEGRLALTPDNLLGICSLIVWGLILVVSVKYVLIMLRADHRGEGGTLALMTLAHTSLPTKSRLYFPLLVLGAMGASLFYGDSIITPAISILSAIEGLEVATPVFRPFVVPIALGIVFALYSVQYKGSAGIGKFIGPVMILWFLFLATLGLINIFSAPEVLFALNPWHAMAFIGRNPGTSFILLGVIVLAFTGAESLYADMGHFGSQPIRRAWFYLVFPSLTLNYLGQGGLLLTDPNAIANPFFMQLGAWSVYPLVFVSTIAVVIASQAAITGAFSITKQAIGLRLLPRMKIVYTSESEMSQVYIPVVNWLHMAAVAVAVVHFKSAVNLASAYGVAVTGVMVITTVFLFFIMRHHWKQNLFVSLMVTAFFFIIDFSLLSSNLLKVTSGGWFPIAIGFFLFSLMMSWRRGRQSVGRSQARHAISLNPFLKSLFRSPPMRVPGTAIFLRSEHDGAPPALLHNLSHNKVLQERVFFLTIHALEVPWVQIADRIKIQELGHDCFQMDFYYGFKDEVDIPRTLELCAEYGYSFDLMTTSFFVSRIRLVSAAKSGMAVWRQRLFIWLSRNAPTTADYYRIPANRVIELGARIEI